MNKLPKIEDINAQYEENAALLLARIAERDEMKELLKIAAPDKIADVRHAIARYDSIIEDTEQVLEILDRMRYLRDILETSEIVLEDQTTIIEKEMRKHFAENAPEKLELLDAMLTDDGKTH